MAGAAELVRPESGRGDAPRAQGGREAGDPNTHLRGILFTGGTRTTYEQALKGFVEIRSGWAESTLQKTRSALAKFGALAGKTESFAAVSRKYRPILREGRRGGRVAGPSRATPSRETVERAIGKFREWDEQSGRSRAAVTERFTRESVQEGHRVEIVGKGGKVQTFEVSAELHGRSREYLERHPSPLADRDGYRMAYARAVEAVCAPRHCETTGAHTTAPRSHRH